MLSSSPLAREGRIQEHLADAGAISLAFSEAAFRPEVLEIDEPLEDDLDR